MLWLYYGNPVGHAVGIESWYGAKIVGQLIGVPSEYFMHKRITNCLLSVNTVAHPKFRGLLLFKQLGLELCKIAKIKVFDFIMGIFNAAATKGFVQHIEFRLISLLHYKHKLVVKPIIFLEKIKKLCKQLYLDMLGLRVP